MSGDHPSGHQSFLVHLDSLTGFARELDTQLEGLTKPADGLAGLTSAPMLLGDFGEAYDLRQGHHDTVGQMYELLGEVRQAISFAGEVTRTVAAGYERADSDIASALDVSGLIDQAGTTGSSLAGGVSGVASGVTTVTATVSSTVAGTVEAAIEAIAGVTATETAGGGS